MSLPLSVVVPLPSVQTSLADWVERLLENAGDLTPHFEVVLVADGASELAQENARELAQRYPQIRVIEPRGASPAIRCGTQAAIGQTVIVLEDTAAASPGRLRELWNRQRAEWRRLTDAASALEASTPGWLRRLLDWGQQLRERSPVQGGPSVAGENPASTDDLSSVDVEQLIREYRRDAAHVELPAARGLSFLQHLRNLAVGE